MIFGFIAAGLLGVVAVAGYKLEVHTSWLEAKADTAQVAFVQQIDPTLRMSEREHQLSPDEYWATNHLQAPDTDRPLVRLCLLNGLIGSKLQALGRSVHRSLVGLQHLFKLGS